MWGMGWGMKDRREGDGGQGKIRRRRT